MAQIQSKIAIIGAGISGIAAAKQLAKHEPVVFEATDSIGGVWKHASFSSTKLQTPRCDYEFSDFPWPDRDDSSFPSHVEIIDYLYSYASHFDVLKFVKFRSKVVELRYLGGENHLRDRPAEYGRLLAGHPAWEVAIQTGDDFDSIQRYTFEFVVVCIGKYGDTPKIPSFPSNKGPQVFKGKVLHTLDYCKLNKEEASSLLKGKSVAIVGYKKSAIDLAVECAQANQGEDGKACTMVIRTLHWTVPHYSIWGLPFYLFYSTRFSQFIYERPDQNILRTLACLLLSPMKQVVTKLIENYLLWRLPYEKYGLKPDHPFLEDYASCQMAILPENFFDEADEGRIKFKKASKWWFYENGIQFDDNTKLEADIVICATGYDGKKKLEAILPQFFSSFLDYNGVMPLYRSTINPMIPNMAFVGYIETVANLQTAELRCKWLANLVDDKFKLPNVEKMLGHIENEVEVMKKTTRFYKRQCISTYSIDHNDQLCEEMGWNSWRKKSWFDEAFSPYTSQDYDKDN
ncbi:probable flavin-containing monooxygenase 1 [Amaranthus tricolor]|uniref:probable flavin-containing monooxygenase 1 n=1 Tax=Amaranthus tricolor TaxID=29722 RepID=UPI00258B5807|nr:probable flavin-containing monooxygenase 1 [Amaranthus tricolor]